MNRKTRTIKKHFKVFCEGDTEYNYIDEMKRKKKLSITLKPVNMKGGGYSSFLEQIKTDSGTNCLAKFIIIDGDRAISDAGEKKKLKELLEYCKLQNQSERTPHFLIVNYPDFEYIACLHTPGYKNQNISQYIMKHMGYKNIGALKADKQIYTALNTNGNSYNQMLSALKKNACFIINNYSINKKLFEIKISTSCKWENLGKNGSNIQDFFEVISGFDT